MSLLSASTQQYSPIPDTDEDVTPIQQGLFNLSRRTKKIINILAISIVVFIIITIMFLYAIREKVTERETVVITQTAYHRGDKLTKITYNDIRSMGFLISKLQFGNAVCSASDLSQNICVPPTKRPARVLIDSDKVYQKIIGFGGAFTEGIYNKL